MLGLTGYFTERIENVWDSRTRDSSLVENKRKGNTDRTRTVLMRNHGRVLGEEKMKTTRTLLYIPYNFTCMMMHKHCCMHFIRMQAHSACTNHSVAFVKVQVNDMSPDIIHKYLNQALEQESKAKGPAAQTDLKIYVWVDAILTKFWTGMWDVE